MHVPLVHFTDKFVRLRSNVTDVPRFLYGLLFFISDWFCAMYLNASIQATQGNGDRARTPVSARRFSRVSLPNYRASQQNLDQKPSFEADPLSEDPTSNSKWSATSALALVGSLVNGALRRSVVYIIGAPRKTAVCRSVLNTLLTGKLALRICFSVNLK